MGNNNRKGPITFPIPTDPGWGYYEISNFPGLHITDNPFITTKGSASDILNLYIDESNKLTTRPRLSFAYDLSKYTDEWLEVIDVGDYTLHLGFKNDVYVLYKKKSNDVSDIEPETEYSIGNSIQNWFIKDGVVYIYDGLVKDDKHYLAYIEDGILKPFTDFYVPTVIVGRTGDIPGSDLEYFNSLTPKYKESWRWDKSWGIVDDESGYIDPLRGKLLSQNVFDKDGKSVEIDGDIIKTVSKGVIVKEDNVLKLIDLKGNVVDHKEIPSEFVDRLEENLSNFKVSDNLETMCVFYEYENDSPLEQSVILKTYKNGNVYEKKISMDSYQLNPSYPHEFRNGVLGISKDGNFVIFSVDKMRTSGVNKGYRETGFVKIEFSGGSSYTREFKDDLKGLSVWKYAVSNTGTVTGLPAEYISQDGGNTFTLEKSKGFYDITLPNPALRWTKTGTSTDTFIEASAGDKPLEGRACTIKNEKWNTESTNTWGNVWEYDLYECSLVENLSVSLYKDELYIFEECVTDGDYRIFKTNNNKLFIVEDDNIKGFYFSTLDDIDDVKKISVDKGNLWVLNDSKIYHSSDFKNFNKYSIFNVDLSTINLETREVKNDDEFLTISKDSGILYFTFKIDDPFQEIIYEKEITPDNPKYDDWFKLNNYTKFADFFIKFQNDYWVVQDKLLKRSKNNNPFYFPIYFHHNEFDEQITGLNRIGDNLLAAYTKTGIHLQQPIQQEDGSYIMSSTETRAIKGNTPLGQSIVAAYSGYPIQIANDGIYALQLEEGVQSAERLTVLISEKINPKLLDENISSCLTLNHSYYTLFVFPKEKSSIYLFDNRIGEWFYWELPIEIISHYIKNNKLYLASSDGKVYRMENQDRFKDPAIVNPITVYGDEVIQGDMKAIEWLWKSQILMVGPLNNMKRLSTTTFLVLDDNMSDSYGLNYKFKAFKKYFTTETDITLTEGDINYIKSVTRRTNVSSFNFLQIELRNPYDDSVYEYDETNSNKLNLVGMILKYKNLPGGI